MTRDAGVGIDPDRRWSDLTDEEKARVVAWLSRRLDPPGITAKLPRDAGSVFVLGMAAGALVAAIARWALAWWLA